MHSGEVMTVQDESATTTDTHGAVLTDAAAAKAKALLDQEGRDDLALRIAVQPGGCAGLRYNLFFDDRTLDGDLIAEFGGVSLTVGRLGAPALLGPSARLMACNKCQVFPRVQPQPHRLTPCHRTSRSSWRCGPAALRPEQPRSPAVGP